jgi:hypothetical protein
MAFAARKIRPDFEEIRAATKLFEEARFYVKDASDNEETRVAMAIIEQHLQQAQVLLGRR